MSSKVTKQSLPYFEDSAAVFAGCADQPWAIFLDSAFPTSQQGRFDIMAYGPVCTLETRGQKTRISTVSQQVDSQEDPFALLKHYLGDTLPAIEGIPFNGGAMGYFAYDLARRIEKLPIQAEDTEHLPDMAVGIYRWAVVVDAQWP
jgi:para-aminobenzoate synthetase component 1